MNRLSVRAHRAIGTAVLLSALLAGCADKAEVDGQHIRVRLVSEQTTVTPGQPFWVGLLQTLDDGWHTYWRNPGDSGAAARIEWHLPDGWTASSIHWPVPERMPYGDLMNFGYSGEVLLPVMITPPADLERGRVELVRGGTLAGVRRRVHSGRGAPSPDPAGAPTGRAGRCRERRPLFDRWRARIPARRSTAPSARAAR